MKIKFFVPGQARPAGSKSAFKHPTTGKIVVTHANPKTKDWMQAVKWNGLQTAQRMCLLEDAVSLTLIFIRLRPKNHYRSGAHSDTMKPNAPVYNTKTPDLTKLTRCVEDALTGIIWKDDSQVVEQNTIKRYCRGRERPGVLIVIETLAEKEHENGKEIWQTTTTTTEVEQQKNDNKQSLF
jgi:Holliday junction resolvase RusA-like endonuclease